MKALSVRAPWAAMIDCNEYSCACVTVRVTDVEKMLERLQRAAIQYANAGRKPASAKNREAFAMAEKSLGDAATAYAHARGDEQGVGRRTGRGNRDPSPR
jgi:hypothetical protein